jgi:hypothetical protein
MGLRSGDPLKPEAKALLKGKTLDQELASAMKDPLRVREAACVIGEAGRKNHLDALLAVPAKDLVPEVFSAILRLKDQKNTPQIQKTMLTWITTPNDTDTILRTLGALKVLGESGWNPELKTLKPLLESEVPEVRVGSHDVLFQRFSSLSGEERKSLMKDALTRDPLQVRVSALRLYRDLKDQDKKALGVDLSKCKKDPEEQVREECP